MPRLMTGYLKFGLFSGRSSRWAFAVRPYKNQPTHENTFLTCREVELNRAPDGDEEAKVEKTETKALQG